MGDDSPIRPVRDAPALLTDLYQLTMLETYFEHAMEETAVFEFYVRALPEGRRFLLAAGLEQLLDYLQTLSFSPAELDWLAQSGRFKRGFIERLAALRFTGDVAALPEGTVFFADEPVVQITAPLPQAQFVESRLINIVHLQSLIASKAARCVLAAQGRGLIDFGMRRAHGAEAALLAARAAYLAGFDGTATVLASARFGIPCFGTMAHSFIEAHEDETEAFRRFARLHPQDNTLLIDTYSTEGGARRVASLAQELRASGISVGAVRIDSGALDQGARAVRATLDAAGMASTRIVVSGGLDEQRIAALVESGEPIDGFGVGTSLDASTDAPVLECAYKLVEYAGEGRRKRSSGKATLPGRKQVYRRTRDGAFTGDVIGLHGEGIDGTALLKPVMTGGRRAAQIEPLAEIRTRARAQMAALPEALLRLEGGFASYPVAVSRGLRRLVREVDRKQQGHSHAQD